MLESTSGCRHDVGNEDDRVDRVVVSFWHLFLQLLYRACFFFSVGDSFYRVLLLRFSFLFIFFVLRCFSFSSRLCHDTWITCKAGGIFDRGVLEYVWPGSFPWWICAAASNALFNWIIHIIN